METLPRAPVRFGPYRFDPHTLELSRDGEAVAIAPQPARLLALLVAHPGEMVTREAIREHVWGDQALDFESGLHTCVRLVRKALGDDSDDPVYVETLPRRGYRFTADLEVERDPATKRERPGPAPPEDESARVVEKRLLGAFALLVLVVVGVVWAGRPASAPESRTEAAPVVDAGARLVVLPFRNLSGQPELDYLGAALADEIRNELARAGSERLGVIAATSSERHGRDDAPVRRIVDELDVSHLLEGSVRSTSAGPAVSVRLIRGADETQLWAHRFTPETAGRRDALLDVARRVADSLGAAMGMALSAPSTAAELAEPEARRAFLEARFLMRPGARDPEAAADRLRTALELEPDLVEARALLAEALYRQGEYDQAESEANRVIAVAPERYEPHLVLGDIELHGRVRPAAAAPHYRRALELAPGVAVVQHSWAGLLLATGRPEASLEPLYRTLSLDPVSPIVHGDMPWYLLYARDWVGVAETTARALGLVPDPDWVRSAPAYAAVLAGEPVEAARRIRDLLEAREAPEAVRDRVASLPPEQVVEYWLRYRLEVTAAADWGSPMELARLHAMLGEADEAMAALRESVQSRSYSLVYVTVDPRLDGIRDHPGYAALMADIDRLLSN